MYYRLAICSLIVLLLLTPLVSRCPADIIIDDFENQSVGSGNGTPLDYFSFGGQLTDRGVTNLLGATSGVNSAFYSIDFDLIGFGVGAAHQNLNLAINADNLVKVNVKFASGLNNGGFIAFRLADADGTVVRTSDSNLFSASGSFQSISQAVSDINFVDFTGTTAGLDLNQITSVGLLFFDQGFSGTSIVAFDDLRIVSVPEPSSMQLSLAVVPLVLVRWRKR